MLVAVFEPVVGRVFHVLFLGPGAFLRLFGVALAGATLNRAKKPRR